MWAVVAGAVKAFGLPVGYVLYDLSYANLVLLGATLPTYGAVGRRGGGRGGVDAGDSRNNAAVAAAFREG